MGLREDIVAALNSNSAENKSNTPDFILGKFLEGCLEAFDRATIARDEWYGTSKNSIADCSIIQPTIGGLAESRLEIADFKDNLSSLTNEELEEFGSPPPPEFYNDKWEDTF